MKKQAKQKFIALLNERLFQFHPFQRYEHCTIQQFSKCDHLGVDSKLIQHNFSIQLSFLHDEKNKILQNYDEQLIAGIMQVKR